MESTIKKSYTKNTLSNGEIEIKYKYSNALRKVMAFLVWLFILGLAGEVLGGAVGFILSTGFIVFYIARLNSSTESVIVVPDVGLKFNNQQIPFNDIAIISVSNGRVYATCNGTKVAVTKSINNDFALAIQNEIMSLSGRSWS